MASQSRTADAARGAATKGGGCRPKGSAENRARSPGRDEERLRHPMSKSLSARELLMSVALSSRGVLCRATAVPRRRRQWIRGREQPPCFAQAPVPGPVRGLPTPRLSVLLSAPRSYARSRSPGASNRRSDRSLDRSPIARSIHNLDERATAASISAVGIKGEQEGEHRGGTPPLREVFPPRARLARRNRGR